MNECYYRLYSANKSYGLEPDFRTASRLPSEGFASLYAVDFATSAAIHAEGTTKGFKGVVWAERLWIDVDSYEAADRTESILRSLGLNFLAYDSGGRGVHFGILRPHPPSHLLPAKDKAWVKAHIPEADASIYTHLHPFRLEGTVHESTGRRKELVLNIPGKSLILPTLVEQEIASVEPSTGNNRSIFDHYRVMLNSVPQHNGQRHEALVRLTYALKDDAGIDAAGALWWVGEVNKMFEEPKSEEDLDKLVRSIYR